MYKYFSHNRSLTIRESSYRAVGGGLANLLKSIIVAICKQNFRNPNLIETVNGLQMKKTNDTTRRNSPIHECTEQ